MIGDEQSCSSMKTSVIPLALLDMPSCVPPGDGLWKPEAQGVKMRQQRGL